MNHNDTCSTAPELYYGSQQWSTSSGSRLFKSSCSSSGSIGGREPLMYSWKSFTGGYHDLVPILDGLIQAISSCPYRT